MYDVYSCWAQLEQYMHQVLVITTAVRHVRVQLLVLLLCTKVVSMRGERGGLVYVRVLGLNTVVGLRYEYCCAATCEAVAVHSNSM